MTEFKSEALIAQPIDKIYNFLSDLNNHQQLMPENIYNWTSTHDEARFTIQNMAKLALKVDSRVENKEIKIIPSESAPFNILMKWVLDESGSSTSAKLIVEADLNMMMKMLASGPLQKLVDHQTQALQQALK